MSETLPNLVVHQSSRACSIGHQSNTLVMAPGGYRFSDYARVGALLDVLIVVTAVPMIMWVWLP